MNPYGYCKVAALSPTVHIGDPKQNVDEMIKLIQELPNDVSLAVFPELSISAYTCGDLFHQPLLIKQCWNECVRLAKAITEGPIVYVGLPIEKDQLLFNCAAVLHQGEIIALIPKSVLPNDHEFYEKRWFASADEKLNNRYLSIDGQSIPFGEHLLLQDDATAMIIGCELCEDLWCSLPPSTYHTMYGANVIVNLSASNETIGKSAYRKQLVLSQSAKTNAAYIYTSAGIDESTTDVVFGSHKMIAENGIMLEEADFHKNTESIIALLDLEKLQQERLGNVSNQKRRVSLPYEIIHIHSTHTTQELPQVTPYPFVPQDDRERQIRCQEILRIQATGLAQRLKKIHCDTLVIGISGGLDSTLALLVALEAFALHGLNTIGIHCVMIPGFGTTKRTHNNSAQLLDLLPVSKQEINIHDACLQHFQDIGHDPSIHDITYENTQARERTQILMDLANQKQGIVLGTGDLSELALGWCTYNGDHMSMYAVNASIPKTLVRYMVETYAQLLQGNDGPYLPTLPQATRVQIAHILQDICETPVSPELLPPSEAGEITQLTEASIGSYDLHDFFLYHMLKNGFSPTKIYALSLLAFPNVHPLLIKETMSTFYRRFFSQQFKRSCLPDGVKVGSICLSPRGDWRMPSDACVDLWLREVESI